MKKKISLKHILICILIIYFSAIFINQQIIISKIKKEQAINTNKLNELKEKNKELQDQVNMSKSLDYIEKVAREKLNMIKKGETPVVNNSD